ncbi:MAG TPA: corrinoid protein [Anaerolineales bacterium]
MEEKMQLLTDLHLAIIDGQRDQVVDLVKRLLEQHADPEIILRNSMIPAMDIVGKRFEEELFFVPEMLIAARAMQAGLDILQPSLAASNIEPIGNVVIGTVQGDIHDIGKNLVAMMLGGAGFRVVDLGVNVPAQKFVDAVQNENGVQIVSLSALLTTTMVNMSAVLEALDKAGLRPDIKVMVGGAPITEAYAQKIGADGYAPDASQAVGLAKRLLGIV